MSSFYNRNLNLLQKQYNNIYHAVKKYKPKGETAVTIVETPSSLPSLLYHSGGQELYLHSRYNPEHEASVWVEKLDEKAAEAENLFVIGLGLGYHVEMLIRKYPDKRLFVYEPNMDIFLAAMQSRNLGKILKHRHLAVFGLGHEKTIQNQVMNHLIRNIKSSMEIVEIPIYKKIYHEMIDQITVEFKARVIDYRSNLATTRVFATEWPENIILNFPKTFNSRSVIGLKDSCKGHAAVVVGSGPSLEYDIPTLKEIRKYAYLFSAGSSVQALLKHGIVPDMTFTVDGSQQNFKVFHDLDYKNIPMMFSPYVNREIIKAVPDDNLVHAVFNTDHISSFLLGYKEKDTKFYSTSSVTGTVMQAAAFFGCTRIILAGQDVSYPNNKVYVDGVDHHAAAVLKKVIEISDIYVENVQGGQNVTKRNMFVTKRDLEQLADLQKGKAEFINTSRLGAKLEGIPFRLMDEVLEELKGEGVTRHADFGAHVRAVSQPYPEDRRTATMNRIREVCEELVTIEADLTELVTEIDLLEENAERKMSKKQILERVDAMWTRICKSKLIYTLYAFVAQPQFIIFKRFQPDIVQERDVKVKADLIYKYLGGLVATLIEKTPKLKLDMDTMREELESRFGSPLSLAGEGSK